LCAATADLARKPHRAVGDQKFGLADASRIQQNLAGGGKAGVVFMTQAEIEVSQRNPAGFSAPAHMDDLLTIRQQRLELGAGLRSRRRFQTPNE